MKDRLLQFLTAEQLSPAHFSDLMGVQRSGVSHILSGRNKPGFDFIEKLLKAFPAINADWLITGRGKMYKEMQTAPLFALEPEVKTAPSPIPTPLSNDLFSIPSVQPEENKATGNNMPIPIPCSTAKKLSRIIIFYDDKSFSEYRPEVE